MSNKYTPKKYFWRNSVIVPLTLRVVKLPMSKFKGVHSKRYKPRNKTFLLIANHNESLDPAYEMLSLMQYVRYVSSDHVVRSGFKGKFLNFFGTPIIKYRDHPREELVNNILETLRIGVSVGIHAEGGMSFNGESRYISQNTAKLIKEAGCAIITYRSYGGYLRSPRWKKHHRKGPLFGQVVREYDPEEISNMTTEEVYQAICNDLYVNAYEEQRKSPKSYVCDSLAESCEIILYRCPMCKQISTLHSHGNLLSCDCGYSLEMKDDGFFHDCGHGVIFDNICEWEHWQRDSVKEYLDGFKGNSETPIFMDENQILVRITDKTETTVSEQATLKLFCDRLTLSYDSCELSIPIEKIRNMDYVKWQSLLIVTDDDYFEVNSVVPRSATKYMDAWRYLTGRPNY